MSRSDWSEVLQILSVSKARNVVVIADTCYSGTLANEASLEKSKNTPSLANDSIRNGRASKGISVITSSSAVEQSFELPFKKEKNSVFTHELLKVLRGDPKVRALEGGYLAYEKPSSDLLCVEVSKLARYLSAFVPAILQNKFRQWTNDNDVTEGFVIRDPESGTNVPVLLQVPQGRAANTETYIGVVKG
jgi:uncharacterized caspase-like protein